MKRIAIIACQMIRNKNLCPGDSKCLVALNRKEGEFARYGKGGAELVGIVECGDCEGNKNRVLLSLGLLKMQLGALNDSVDVVHMGSCIMKFCKRKDDLLQALKEKAGVEVVEGSHAYMPQTIF